MNRDPSIYPVIVGTGLFVLVAFGAHVVELAAQFCVLLAERGLAGRDGVLGLDPGVEAVLQVGVLVG
jgi:hypothetical protein